LSTLLKDEFYAIPVPLYDIFQSSEINHTELIYAMTLRLLKEATELKVMTGSGKGFSGSSRKARRKGEI
jgi:hypothetical protein